MQANNSLSCSTQLLRNIIENKWWKWLALLRGYILCNTKTKKDWSSFSLHVGTPNPNPKILVSWDDRPRAWLDLVMSHHGGRKRDGHTKPWLQGPRQVKIMNERCKILIKNVCEQPINNHVFFLNWKWDKKWFSGRLYM